MATVEEPLTTPITKQLVRFRITEITVMYRYDTIRVSVELVDEDGNVLDAKTIESNPGDAFPTTTAGNLRTQVRQHLINKGVIN